MDVAAGGQCTILANEEVQRRPLQGRRRLYTTKTADRDHTAGDVTLVGHRLRYTADTRLQHEWRPCGGRGIQSALTTNDG